eukprot:TRINITY_DN599_c0_g1_i3.p1 TRINITY_DN599_c0_g1~~TRINITY_DN599_c0_g1_i3.p1  ORF type:complete len:973 (+),score=438.01 TRINITY_DN599_c0_g1_i3:900-3818(+)
MTIIADEDVDKSIQQSAVVYLKNLCMSEWTPNQSTEKMDWGTLTDDDRNILKENMIVIISNARIADRKILGDITRHIIREDFDDGGWDFLVDEIIRILEEKDRDLMFGGLLALRQLAKHFEYKEERGAMLDIQEQVFPLVLPLLKELMEEESVESALLQKLILKFYFSSFRMNLHEFILQDDVFLEWMECFATILETPVPAEERELDEDRRDAYPYWKLKKWVLHIWFRFINRYGFAEHNDDDEELYNFGKHLNENYSETMMNYIIDLVKIPNTGEYLPARLVAMGLSSLTLLLLQGETFMYMKPKLDEVLFDIIFPNLVLTPLELEEFEDNPEEYIRRLYDIDEEVHSAKPAACELLMYLCRFRGKTVFGKWMNHMREIMVTYNDTPDEDKDHLLKEAALLGVGTLEEKLKHSDVFAEKIPMWLSDFVLPEFGSEMPFLRARAAWTVSQFVTMEFEDPAIFSDCLNSTLDALTDESLPVRIMASIALRTFLQDDDVKDLLEPHMEELLNVLMDMIGLSASDDVVATLNEFVYMFGEEIVPYAVDMIKRMAEELEELLKEDRDDDVAAQLAVESLRLVRTLVAACQENEETMAEIEVILMPVLRECLMEDGMEYFDEALEIISFLTYCTPEVSDDMWDLFPMITDAFFQFAYDYLGEMLRPLINYMTRDAERMVNGADGKYLKALLDMCEFMLVKDHIAEFDAGSGAQLMINMLQYCEGMLDDHIGDMLEMCLERRHTTKSMSLQVLLADTFAAFFHYNAELTANTLAEMNELEYVIDVWMAACESMKRQYDLKLTSIGLTAILNVNPEQMPSLLQEQAMMLVETNISALIELGELQEIFSENTAEERRQKQIEEEEEDMETLNPNYDELADDESALLWDNAAVDKLMDKLKAAGSDFQLADDDDVDTPVEDVDEFIIFCEMMENYEDLEEELDDQMKENMEVIRRNATSRQKAREAAERQQGEDGFKFREK